MRMKKTRGSICLLFLLLRQASCLLRTSQDKDHYEEERIFSNQQRQQPWQEQTENIILEIQHDNSNNHMMMDDEDKTEVSGATIITSLLRGSLSLLSSSSSTTAASSSPATDHHQRQQLEIEKLDDEDDNRYLKSWSRIRQRNYYPRITRPPMSESSLVLPSETTTTDTTTVTAKTRQQETSSVAVVKRPPNDGGDTMDAVAESATNNDDDEKDEPPSPQQQPSPSTTAIAFPEEDAASPSCKLVDSQSTYIITFTGDTSLYTDMELIHAFDIAYDTMMFFIVGCTAKIKSITIQQREKDGGARETSLAFYIRSKVVTFGSTNTFTRMNSLLVLPDDEPLFLWGFNAALESTTTTTTKKNKKKDKVNKKDNAAATTTKVIAVAIHETTMPPTSSPTTYAASSIASVSSSTIIGMVPSSSTTNNDHQKECNFVSVTSTYIVSFFGDPYTFSDEELTLAFNLGYDALIFLVVGCTPEIQSILVEWRSTTPSVTNNANNNNKGNSMTARGGTGKKKPPKKTNNDSAKDKRTRQHQQHHNHQQQYDLFFEVRAKQVSGSSLLVLPDDEVQFLWGFNEALDIYDNGDDDTDNNKKVTAFAVKEFLGPTNSPTNIPSSSPSSIPTPVPTTMIPTSSTMPSSIPTKEISFGPLTYVGNDHDGYYYSLYPMRVCEGDCDKDQDCQEGLYCHSRDKFEKIPFCSGGETVDTSADYCTWDTSYPPPPPHPTPPTGAYRIKLYWDSTYRWQNETYDREWCMIHDFDGYPGNGECHYAVNDTRPCKPTQLYLGYCLDGDPRQWFTLTDLGTTYSQSEDRREWLITTVSTSWAATTRTVAEPDRCLIRRSSQLYLTDKCNPNDERQRFFALNGKIDPLDSTSRFELGQYHGYTLDNCVTNAHHPKSGEVIEFHVCEDARNNDDETSFWQLIL